MVKCCVFFAVQTELFNIIQMSFNFKGLMNIKTSEGHKVAKSASGKYVYYTSSNNR
jgi:hypothetical protein